MISHIDIHQYCVKVLFPVMIREEDKQQENVETINVQMKNA